MPDDPAPVTVGTCGHDLQQPSNGPGVSIRSGACDNEPMSEMRAKVEEVVEAIRPAIQVDNGDIELIGVDEETGVVSVELVGACVSCPASTVTLKAGIERIMKDRVPGVTEVVNVGQTLFDDGTAVTL